MDQTQTAYCIMPQMFHAIKLLLYD